jgi:hypothetical protein
MGLVEMFKEDVKKILTEYRKEWIRRELESKPNPDKFKKLFYKALFTAYREKYRCFDVHFEKVEEVLREDLKDFLNREFEKIWFMVSDLIAFRNMIFPKIIKNPFGGCLTLIVEGDRERWLESKIDIWSRLYTISGRIKDKFTGVWIFREKDITGNPYLEKWIVDELLTYGQQKIEHGDPEWGLVDISSLHFKVGSDMYYALKFDFPDSKYYPYEIDNDVVKIWKKEMQRQGIDFKGSFYLDIYGKIRRYFTLSPLGGIENDIVKFLPEMIGDLKAIGKI